MESFWITLGWLCYTGMFKVSHFDFWHLADPYRFDLWSSTLMLESIGLPAMLWGVSMWLRNVSTYLVSHFIFSHCFVIDMLGLELYRCDLDSITSPVLDINIVVVYLLHYISTRAHYSRVRSTTVPSVACQTTEGEYLLLTIPTY